MVGGVCPHLSGPQRSPSALSYFIPLLTVMAWCMAAACGGLLCNLGGPSGAVSRSCHLVGRTQSPRQQLASTVLFKYTWHARKLKNGRNVFKLIQAASQFSRDWFVFLSGSVCISEMIKEEHTDFCLICCLHVTEHSVSLFMMHQPTLMPVWPTNIH